jgi:hypothetical protein
VNPIDLKVGTHHHPNFSFLHSRIERRLINFQKGAFAGVFIDREAASLLVIAGKMFDPDRAPRALPVLDVPLSQTWLKLHSTESFQQSWQDLTKDPLHKTIIWLSLIRN